MPNGNIRLVPAVSATSSEDLVKRAIAAGHSEEHARKAVAHVAAARQYLSECGTYQVSVHYHTPNGFGADMTHLSIKRVDKEPVHDWRDLQEIKNQLVGEECEAIELYPAESRRVDSANQYHLWCFTDPEDRLPFGFSERLVTDAPFEGTKQRSFETTATKE